MLPVLREGDCPQDPILGWTLAVLGYGNQGRAQALNLRDSGHAVIVGARPGRLSAELASSEGFHVVDPAHLAEQADLIAVLLPDEEHRKVVESLMRGPRGKPRIKALIFAHGLSLRFDPPDLDPAWDVAVVAPSGPGVQLRTRFEEGSGIPALVAVHLDRSGLAAHRARAYGAAIGCARAGMIETTVAAEAEVDLFGEQVVLCGGMNALLQAAFETLTRAGYPEELAYLECVQQLRLTAELIEKYGMEGMRQRISRTALFGDLTRGPRIIDSAARGRMSEILEEIRSGVFAREWLCRSTEAGWPEEDLERARSEPIERAGRSIRELCRPNLPEGPAINLSADGQSNRPAE